MKKSFPIQMLQNGGEVDEQQQQLARRKRAMELQHITPQFLPGVPLGMRPKKKKKPQDPLEPLAPQPQQGMQRGGKVKARGTDTVPIMATPGEFVLNRGAVAAAGKPFLNYLNQIGKGSPAMMQEGGVVGKDKKELFPVQYRQTGGQVSPVYPRGWVPFNLPPWSKYIPPVAIGSNLYRAVHNPIANIQNAAANKGGQGGGGTTGGTNWGSVFIDPSWINPPNIPITNQGVPAGGDNIPVEKPVIVQNPDTAGQATRGIQSRLGFSGPIGVAGGALPSTAISGGGSGSALSGIGQYFEGAVSTPDLSALAGLGGAPYGFGPRILHEGGEVTADPQGSPPGYQGGGEVADTSDFTTIPKQWLNQLLQSRVPTYPPQVIYPPGEQVYPRAEPVYPKAKLATPGDEARDPGFRGMVEIGPLEWGPPPLIGDWESKVLPPEYQFDRSRPGLFYGGTEQIPGALDALQPDQYGYRPLRLQGGGEVAGTEPPGGYNYPTEPALEDAQRKFRDAMMAASRRRAKAVPSADVFADTQDAMLQHPGIISLPTMDFDNTGDFSTATYEMDGKTYILPTMPGWTQQQTVSRFQQTGEHMGVFNNDANAQSFDQQFINLRGEKSPQGYQGGGMVRGGAGAPPSAASVRPAAFPINIAGILRGIGNQITQNRLRQQHFAHLASRNFNPNFQPQRKASPKSRRTASPFNPMRG
jgi:hypothetical protein